MTFLDKQSRCFSLVEKLQPVIIRDEQSSHDRTQEVPVNVHPLKQIVHQYILNDIDTNIFTALPKDTESLQEISYVLHNRIIWHGN